MTYLNLFFSLKVNIFRCYIFYRRGLTIFYIVHVFCLAVLFADPTNCIDVVTILERHAQLNAPFYHR